LIFIGNLIKKLDDKQKIKAKETKMSHHSKPFYDLKEGASKLFRSLNIEIWNLFEIWCLKFGIS